MTTTRTPKTPMRTVRIPLPAIERAERVRDKVVVGTTLEQSAVLRIAVDLGLTAIEGGLSDYPRLPRPMA